MSARPSSLAWLAALLALLAGSVGFVAYSGYRMLTTPETTAAIGPAKTAARPAVSETAARVPEPAATASGGGRLPPEDPGALRLPAEDPHEAVAQTPDAAFRDLRAALERQDAPAAAKYLLAAKRARMRSIQEALSELTPLEAEQVRITKVTQRGGKAVLYAQTESPDITSADGQPAAIDVVVQLLQEDGQWKVFRQLWLVNTPPEDDQREALAWLSASAPAKGAAGDAVRKLAALGVANDASSFQSAVARHDAEQVRLFLQAGLSPATKVSGSDDSLFSLALLGMAGGGDAEAVVLAMIGAGAPLEERTPTGLTALARALVSCRPAVVEALLRAGANLMATDNDGRTPLAWARMSCPAVVPLLRRAGAR
jgi:hypothetical protein